MTYWTPSDSPLDCSYTGTNEFRLMSSDDFSSAPATSHITTGADGYALVVTYSWSHPDDGPQHGVLLVASPGEDDQVEATWVDSWHQKPGPLHLTGTSASPERCELRGTYYVEWGWEVDLDQSNGLTMVMRNVVPESAIDAEHAAAGMTAGPYDVMVMRTHGA